MKQLKKTLLTLVALLAVTTQAWATDVYLVGNGTGNWLNGVAWDPGVADNKMTEQNGVYSITFTNVAANSELQFKFAIKGTWDENYGCISDTENELNKTLSNIELFGTNINFGLTEPADVTISFNLSEMTYMISTKGMKVGDDASTATPVDDFAWNAEAKTGTFTMPGGNVTLEPDYYPQATVADGGVTAADADARATTDDPLVKVDATKLTGAKKLMYFVSNSGTTAPAYDAEGWTDQLPTAEGFTKAGIVYVYYYPVGTDEGVDGATATYSDGDICLESITARIADAPTYAVTFAEGTPETDKWSADPATGVKKGETVTVTYTGSKKVIGVKAEKKKAGKPITIGEQNYTVLDGETWKQFITRNQLSGWYVEQYHDGSWRVYKDSGSAMYTLYVSTDGTNWGVLKLTSEDAPIDTDKQYTMGL